MKVIYAVYTYKRTKLPFMVIFDKTPFVVGRSSVVNNFEKFHERQATDEEVKEIEGNGNRRYLAFSYRSLDLLIGDEAMYGVTVPTEVINEMREFEIKIRDKQIRLKA